MKLPTAISRRRKTLGRLRAKGFSDERAHARYILRLRTELGVAGESLHDHNWENLHALQHLRRS